METSKEGNSLEFSLTSLPGKLSRLISAHLRKVRKLLIRARLCPIPMLVLGYSYAKRRRSAMALPKTSESSWPGFSVARGATVINLDSRKDRLEDIRLEFDRMGIPLLRLPATQHENGGIGCALSHLRAIERMEDQKEPVFIVEDDAQFMQPRNYVDEVVQEFLENPALDVLCLGFKSPCKGIRVGRNLRISVKLSTTVAYMAKPAALTRLKASFQESVSNLSEGLPWHRNALDVLWQETQLSELIFSIPDKKCVRQKASFSDIEGKFVDYGR